MPHIRTVLELFRQGQLTAVEAAEDLGVSKRRVYHLLADYLKAYAAHRHTAWKPGRSGGNHMPTWPEEVCHMLRRRLSSKPPESLAK